MRLTPLAEGGGFSGEERGGVVRRAAGKLPLSTMYVSRSPTEGSMPGTRPERLRVTPLIGHDRQNEHVVPLQVEYRWDRSGPLRCLPAVLNFFHGDSSVDCMSTKNLCCILGVYAACLTLHVLPA